MEIDHHGSSTEETCIKRVLFRNYAKCSSDFFYRIILLIASVATVDAL